MESNGADGSLIMQAPCKYCVSQLGGLMVMIVCLHIQRNLHRYLALITEVRNFQHSPNLDILLLISTMRHVSSNTKTSNKLFKIDPLLLAPHNYLLCLCYFMTSLAFSVRLLSRSFHLCTRKCVTLYIVYTWIKTLNRCGVSTYTQILTFFTYIYQLYFEVIGFLIECTCMWIFQNSIATWWFSMGEIPCNSHRKRKKCNLTLT